MGLRCIPVKTLEDFHASDEIKGMQDSCGNARLACARPYVEEYAA